MVASNTAAEGNPPPASLQNHTDGHDSEPDTSSEEEEIPKLNNVGDLRKGIIKTQKNRANQPYTILLVGETGVGKSSVLEFLANVLAGNPAFKYEFDIIEQENESGGSDSQSQTNEARLYDFESRNGQVVRILDTPGLADTRGLQQDELHKRSIASVIQKQIDSVNAVIILANGTVPRITVGTEYALSTLSAIFPKSLANNIAFLFTNVSSPLSWNFSQDSVPKVLKDSPQYLLDNPLALQKKYDQLKNNPASKNLLKKMKNAVSSGENAALDMLVDVFDWLDKLVPQPTTEILTLYEQSQNIEQMISNTIAQMEQAAGQKKSFEKLVQAIQSGEAHMSSYSEFEQVNNALFWEQQPSTSHNTLCSETSCYQNCHVDCQLGFTLNADGLKGCWAMTEETCRVCRHSLWKHSHYRVLWKQVSRSQVSTDEEMKAKWENAKAGKERDEEALKQLQVKINDLDKSIEDSITKLAELAANYADLSLSGSFSAQVEKAIKLLEQKLQSMQESGVDASQLQKVEDSLDAMRRKLKVLKNANEIANKERGKSRSVVARVQQFWSRR